MASTFDSIKQYLPNISVASFGTVLIVFIGIIIFLVIFGVGLYLFIRWLKFNISVTILEDVAGSNDLEPVGKDKAMLVKVGEGGTQLLYLRKRKLYRGAYGKRMGIKRYYFAIGADGLWYNVTLGSLEEGMKKIGIKPTNVNMRYQNEALQELIKQRYEKKGFWEQYGQIVINIVFFMLVAVMFWLYFASFKQTAPAMVQAADSLKEAAGAIKQAVGGLDTLKATGGLRPA